MPPRTDPRYAPGLDGIRALAVAIVVAYHLRVPRMDGGLLGVSVFFTLSGYLITSILLDGFRSQGTIEFKSFWLRRARRLLPAAWSVLLVVLLVAALVRSPKLGAVARQAFFALVYAANWSTIAQGDDYFNRFSGPGPLDHLWSLAIEEQFYLVWPAMLLGLLLLGVRLGRSFAGRGLLLPSALATGAFTVASTASMAWHYLPTAINNTRAYEGTDTRAAALLVGALAALWVPLRDVDQGGRARRLVLEVVGLVAFVVVTTCVLSMDESSARFYRGGELLLSFATAGLVLAAAHPETLSGRALAVAPLRWLGARSYGVYLWHMPVVAFTPVTLLAGREVARGALQVALILGLAGISYELLEEPIRRSRPLTARRFAGMVVVVPLATGALSIWPILAAAPPVKTPALLEPTTMALPEPAPVEAAPVPSVVRPPDALLTACKTVIYVGDSTSLALTSREYLPKLEDQLAARHQAVGVEHFTPEISGARSIVEKYNDKPSAWEVVHKKRGSGYDGCWVFALGTNDPANVKGNLPGLAQRIGWMMVQAEGRPVLWSTTKTLLGSGPYKNAHMESWTTALVQACERYPNMRVYDWASEVQDSWYLPDGIHPNPTGARERAVRLAKAIARAFPRDGAPSPGCLVRSTP